jgi:hypothetical protein
LRSSLRHPGHHLGVTEASCGVVATLSGRHSAAERQWQQLCIWAAAAGNGQGGLSLPLCTAACCLSLNLFFLCLCIVAGWLLALVACLEMPEREKERRERRLGVEEERIRF